MISQHFQPRDPTHEGGAKRPYRVLLVDDDRLQLKLSALRLRHAGFIVTTASTAREALELANSDPPDAILSDVVMGETDGFDLCRRLRDHVLLESVPILLLSAHYRDLKGRQLATQVGASALVGRTPGFDAELKALRDALGQERTSGRRLVARDVTQAHLRTNVAEVAKLAGAAKIAGDRYRALFEHADDTISVLSRSGIILEANERWSLVLGAPAAGIVGKHLLELAPRAREANGAELEAAIARGAGRVNAVAIERADGANVYLDFSISVIETSAESLVLAIGRDVTERLLAAQTLASAEEKYRSLVERMPEVVWSAAAGVVTFVTCNIESLTGFSVTEIYAADQHFWRQRVHHDDRGAFIAATRLGATDDGKLGFDLQYRWRRKDGAWVWLWHRTTANYERDGVRHTDGLVSDITQRRLLEESLRQSQKMDALGQLTGGIAHDFNNIIAVILSNSQFLIEALGENDPNVVDAQEIRLAAERAASLTRQLLAFSRKQVLQVQIVDVNLLVVGMERLLRRLLGADIQLSVSLGERLGKVRVDAGQLEQVVMNLAVNARDAMPSGGKLSIETTNVELDESTALERTNATGGYVMIAVTDTGLGMDTSTQRHIFEPFFTTKEAGSGTGLGLATCHGIVSQSGGHIAVVSAPGAGSVFKVYLPRLDASAVEPEEAPDLAAEELGGDETVLLVEDDPQLSAAIRRMLTSHGYKVLLAAPAEAAELAKRHGPGIALLLTDVVMPGLNGSQVASAVTAQVPQLKVLFMSGYTANLPLNTGSSSAVVNFIQKPFAPKALLKKLRATLDG